jgi:hypothetical protein
MFSPTKRARFVFKVLFFYIHSRISKFLQAAKEYLSSCLGNKKSHERAPLLQEHEDSPQHS